MREVVVVDAVRTPVGKGHPEKGLYKDIRADDLGVVLCIGFGQGIATIFERV